LQLSASWKGFYLVELNQSESVCRLWRRRGIKPEETEKFQRKKLLICVFQWAAWFYTKAPTWAGRVIRTEGNKSDISLFVLSCGGKNRSCGLVPIQQTPPKRMNEDFNDIRNRGAEGSYRTVEEELKTKLRGLSPQANYTDRATAACRRS
jgi:hypothetical protein